MKLEILTPEKRLFNGEVDSVMLPGTLGPFHVLPNHAPIISSLVEGGKVTCFTGNQKESFAITGGFVEVLHNHVTVCVG